MYSSPGCPLTFEQKNEKKWQQFTENNEKKMTKIVKKNEKKMTKLLNNSCHYLKFCNHAT